MRDIASDAIPLKFFNLFLRAKRREFGQFQVFLGLFSSKFDIRASRKDAKSTARNTATEGMATKGHKDHKELRPDGPLSLALSPLSGEGRRAAREKCSQL